MPIVSASNGVRPEIRALAVLKLNKTVTPKEINDYVGTGDYAAKYVSFLNTRYGFTITAQKDGRKTVSYTCVAEPANAAELRAMKPKTKAKAPTKMAQAIVAKAADTVRSRKVVAKAAAAKKPKNDIDFDDDNSSFAVDKDWDALDAVDIKNLIR